MSSSREDHCHECDECYYNKGGLCYFCDYTFCLRHHSIIQIHGTVLHVCSACTRLMLGKLALQIDVITFVENDSDITAITP
jgi:hypothetical protein